MRHIAIFLAAVGGGLLGGVVVHLAGPSRVSAPNGARSQLDGSIEDALARLRQDNEELRARLTRLEKFQQIGDALSPVAGDEAIAPASLNPELLEAMREVAREEATTVAGSAPPGTTTDAERTAAVAELLNLLAAPHEDTRRNGIRRLRRMYASEASAQVLQALDDESALVRGEAAAYFEDIWDPAALEPLVALMHGEDDGVAEQALDALCKSGNEQALIELEEYYLRGPVLDVAYEAGKALEENKRPTVLPNGVQRFRDALRSADAGERVLGVAGVGRWGSVADESLVRVAETDEDARVRDRAGKVLEGWGLVPRTSQ